MRDWCKFYRCRNGEIDTPGLSFSGRLTVKHQGDQFEVWHKASGKAWPGNGSGLRSWPTDPAWLAIVEIEKDGAVERFRTVKQVEHGHNRRVLAELIAECGQMGE